MAFDGSSTRNSQGARRDFMNTGRKGFAGRAAERWGIRSSVVTTMAKVQGRVPAIFARWVDVIRF